MVRIQPIYWLPGDYPGSWYSTGKGDHVLNSKMVTFV